MQSVTPEEWSAMSDSAKDEHYEKNGRPYLAANGHTMAAFSKWAGGRPVWSSAWTSCVDDCPACRSGERLTDW